MPEKEFDSRKHHLTHYGTDQLDFLSPEVAVRKFVHFEEVILDTIQEQKGPVYGVVVYGSWARVLAGLLDQVHTYSDLDLYTISKRPLKKRPWKFLDKLAEGRTKDNWWGKIGIYVACYDNLPLSDKKRVYDEFFGRGKLIGKHYVIVTPYPEIEQRLKGFLAGGK